MKLNFDIAGLKAKFPACSLEINGEPISYMDGPGGTQMPQSVIDRMNKYMIEQNAYEGEDFKAALGSIQFEDEVREAVADFLGCTPSEVGLGLSTTQNNANFAYAYLKYMKPGDEVIVTEIDHRANVAAWKNLTDYGMVVKTVRLDPETCQLDLDDFKAKLSNKTKIAAFNWGSNALGTVTDVKQMVDLAHEVGAITVIDAVHYSAHFPVDVKALDTDILVCSAYKWFGPHVGVIYVKQELLDKVQYNNVHTEDLTGPRVFHMGTPQYELLVGVTEAINFIAEEGAKYTDVYADQLTGLSGRRKNIVAGMLAFDAYESDLAKQLRIGLREISGVTVYGPEEGQPRTPTVPFTIAGQNSAEVAKKLGERNINVWSGDFYAVEVVDVLGLRSQGGLVRLGLAPYVTQTDIDRTLQTVKQIAAK